MKPLFRPVIWLMNRLLYPQKFILVSLLPLVPLAVVFFQFMSGVTFDITFNAREKIGLVYHSAVMDFLEAVQAHALVSSLVLSGDESFGERLGQQQSAVEDQITLVDAVNRDLGDELGVDDLWRALKADWQGLSDNLPARTFAGNLQAHNDYINGVVRLITVMGNNSNLILDPDIDSYWLMDLEIFKQTQIAGYVGQVNAYAARALARGRLTVEERARLTILTELVRATSESSALSFFYTFGARPTLASQLQPARDRHDAALDRLLGQVDEAILSDGGVSATLALRDFLTNATAAQSEVYALHRSITPALDNLIQARIDAYVVSRNLVLVITLSALVVMIYLFTGFYLAVMGAIAYLDSASKRMVSGQMQSQLVLSNRDELAQVAISFNNIANELIAARERAERSDQVKSAFLASMSHELRTPLNSVLNFTKFVIKGRMGPVTERQVEALNKVVGSGKHLLNLINHVLDMSKIESGSLNLFVEEDVKFADLLETAVQSAMPLLEDKPVKLEIAVQPNLPLMRGDKQRILQIMLNIISNACKFTATGTIHVAADCVIEQGTEVVRFSVRDTGPGIALSDQPAVFEAFKQTETGLRQGGGTGLGMPITKSLVEVHAGRLWFESEVGKGTTFYVTLPIKSDKLIPIAA